ncbi:hypothetical protein DID80_05130 [Candidatus Marinamargulisbacteria bacterium SCGC AAA071-K20]|nr:hypothetical protein DID80_05130 [Candidatus Marinamargulisbacteria bacterium SCGC AAA071-K20]
MMSPGSILSYVSAEFRKVACSASADVEENPLLVKGVHDFIDSLEESEKPTENRCRVVGKIQVNGTLRNVILGKTRSIAPGTNDKSFYFQIDFGSKAMAGCGSFNRVIFQIEDCKVKYQANFAGEKVASELIEALKNGSLLAHYKKETPTGGAYLPRSLGMPISAPPEVVSNLIDHPPLDDFLRESATHAKATLESKAYMRIHSANHMFRCLSLMPKTYEFLVENRSLLTEKSCQDLSHIRPRTIQLLQLAVSFRSMGRTAEGVTRDVGSGIDYIEASIGMLTSWIREFSHSLKISEAEIRMMQDVMRFAEKTKFTDLEMPDGINSTLVTLYRFPIKMEGVRLGCSSPQWFRKYFTTPEDLIKPGSERAMWDVVKNFIKLHAATFIPDNEGSISCRSIILDYSQTPSDPFPPFQTVMLSQAPDKPYGSFDEFQTEFHATYNLVRRPSTESDS